MTPQRRFSASVVGGGVGGQLSMMALASSPHFKLLAVADLRADVREQLVAKFPGVRTFSNHQAMFDACPTDIVCVSTYPPSHEQVTMDALSQLPLKGILVEKPLGPTYSTGQRILGAVRAKRIPMAVPHGLMAKRTPLEVIELVHGGKIGELRLVEIQCRRWDIINAGIHWLNFFVNLTKLETVDWVLAAVDPTTRTYRDGMQVETVAVTTLQTRSGTRLVMHTGDDVVVNDSEHETLFRLYGAQGRIEFYGWELPYNLLNADSPTGMTIYPPEMPVVGHRFHLERMAVQIDSAEVDYSFSESSLLALELCEAAYISGRHRVRVTLPLDRFITPLPSDWEPGRPYGGVGGGRDGRKLEGN